MVFLGGGRWRPAPSTPPACLSTLAGHRRAHAYRRSGRDGRPAWPEIKRRPRLQEPDPATGAGSPRRRHAPCRRPISIHACPKATTSRTSSPGPPSSWPKSRKTPSSPTSTAIQQNRGTGNDGHHGPPHRHARMGIAPQAIDDTLYDAFGQRQVSTMYTPLNQYHVVMEAQPRFLQSPSALKDIYVRTAGGGLTPLGAVAKYTQDTTFLNVNHQGLFPSVTISFNLPPGMALSDASPLVKQAEQDIGLPATIHGSFQGTLQVFEASKANEPFLIASAATLAVYHRAGNALRKLRPSDHDPFHAPLRRSGRKRSPAADAHPTGHDGPDRHSRFCSRHSLKRTAS